MIEQPTAVYETDPDWILTVLEEMMKGDKVARDEKAKRALRETLVMMLQGRHTKAWMN